MPLSCPKKFGNSQEKNRMTDDFHDMLFEFIDAKVDFMVDYVTA